MKLIKVITALSCALLGMALSATALAETNVTGDWTAGMSSPNGNVTIAYTLKQEGSELTGTVTGPDGSENAVSDGKIEDDNISFNVNVEFQGMPMTVAYAGKIQDNSMINFDVTVFGQTSQLTATRVDAAGG